MTLIVSTMGLYKAKVLSTPSPNEILRTVNEELRSRFFLAMQTPSKYCVLSLYPSAIRTPILTVSPAKNSGIFFFAKIFFILALFISSIFFIYLFYIFPINLDVGVVLYPLIALNASV